MSSVARNCFARGEYNRHSAGPGQCHWCGQDRKRLYTYVWDKDASSRRPDHSRSRPFCNLSCFRSYHS
jgi:hypothetical protein